jgi:hypothetical protein
MQSYTLLLALEVSRSTRHANSMRRDSRVFILDCSGTGWSVTTEKPPRTTRFSLESEVEVETYRSASNATQRFVVFSKLDYQVACRWETCALGKNNFLKPRPYFRGSEYGLCVFTCRLSALKESKMTKEVGRRPSDRVYFQVIKCRTPRLRSDRTVSNRCMSRSMHVQINARTNQCSHNNFAAPCLTTNKSISLLHSLLK